MSSSVWRNTKRKIIRDAITACMSTPASCQSFSDVDGEFYVRRMVQASFYERGTRGPSVEFYHRVIRGHWQTASQDAVIDIKDIMFHDREASIEGR